MRPLISFMVTTADGYHEGPEGEFDWPNVDAEFNEFAVAQLDEIGTLVFGRATYAVMASHWPTPTAQRDDPAVAARMNAMPKIVASRTLERADWQGTRLVRDDVAGEITRLKRGSGKLIAVFGSSNLTVHLLDQGLVDELRIMVNPVLLGAGRPLFENGGRRTRLELLRTRSFASGNILHCYRPLPT